MIMAIDDEGSSGQSAAEDDNSSKSGGDGSHDRRNSTNRKDSFNDLISDQRRDTTTPKGFQRSRAIASNYERSKQRRRDPSTPRDKSKHMLGESELKDPASEKDEDFL